MSSGRNFRGRPVGDEITIGLSDLSHPVVGTIIRDLIDSSRADRPG